MLSAKDNERLTQVGPGTPMGRLLRWYWHPIAAVSQLDENPVKRVKLLGESLVLYRDRSGNLGLISEVCAHRRASLLYGIPEPEGLRCPYHGWLYDGTGQCLEMPAEEDDTTFPSRIRIDAYPVQVLTGLIFAYLGPQPAPLLPRWDLFVCENVKRDIGFQVIPCNWLQMQENNMDPAHLQWLHGYFSNYVMERIGRQDLQRVRGRPERQIRDWDLYEYGIIKRARRVDGSTGDPGWRIGSGFIFPNIESVSTNFQYRVPIDDTHTLHVHYSAYPQPPAEVVRQDSIPYYTVPMPIDAEGNPIWAELDSNGGQDAMIWVTQGAVADRTKEKLGGSDKGVILFRELVQRQLELSEDGGEPICVIREPEKNVRIDVPRYGLPLDVWQGPNGSYMRRINGPWKYAPVVKEMIERYLGEEALKQPVH